MNTVKSFLVPAAIAFPIWTILWIPVSFLFEQNPVISAALLAPILGFTSFHRIGGWQTPLFEEITFPWMVYWIGLAAAVILIRRLRKNTGSE